MEVVLPAHTWERIFDSAPLAEGERRPARVRAVGRLRVDDALHVGDPLAGNFSALSVTPGDYVVELAMASGKVAAARAMLDGAKPVKHRLTCHFVVDAGTACFAGHEPALSDDERDSLMSPNPEQLGDPPWLASFPSGWGDGHYAVFGAYDATERPVGAWVDFRVLDIAESEAEPSALLTDAELRALFDALEVALLANSQRPDHDVLHSDRRRPVHAELFPRLLRLLAHDRLFESAGMLAKSWFSDFSEFQRMLAEASFSHERWEELVEYKLFEMVLLEEETELAIEQNRSMPKWLRMKRGHAKTLWPEAVADLNGDGAKGSAVAFFSRRDAVSAAPSSAARDAVEKVLVELAMDKRWRSACMPAIANLRSVKPSNLP
jgi:hypothetical protein